jgi:hypothetical protein
MTFGTDGARDLLVGDVSDDNVGERELRLTEHDRVALAAYEVLPLELVEPMLDGPARLLADCGERPQPERLAHDRGRLDELLLLVGQSVEPGSDDCLHRLGVGERRAQKLHACAIRSQQASVDQHADVLLCVQRVPAGSRKQRRLELLRDLRRVEQVRDKPSGLVVGERLELEFR